ncbi:hypothetical protein CLM62_12590 [Streptomyces sp. SA15]|uniref:molecular chaperone TorD family protein n=1 Tax=Streptomyces sp. SA15 TaxID=934019 RepID=UPI000BAF7578|nr:molecular chaperone TorD family protein [Streptomyces sp. SA15]PAZ15627.1 hypothetical protein CLM62_12590 [Streptomyces sp. SA15]
MTVAVYRRLWCDHKPCGSWHGPADLPGETAAELRRTARSAGWRRKNGKDLCPDHAAGGTR